MSKLERHGLSRRERQIMDVIYAAREATVAAVLAALPDPPSYSAVRALLRILEEKGHLKHRDDKGKYVYLPVRPPTEAARSALIDLLKTFFENSAARAVATLLDVADANLSPEEIGEIKQLIDQASKRRRR